MRTRWALVAGLVCAGAVPTAAPARAGAEVRLDKDFLGAVVGQLPETKFGKDGQYRGVARAFRLVGIDPAKRRVVATCSVVGEYRPPVVAAVRKATEADKPGAEPGGWKAFAFDVTVGARAEPGLDGVPRLDVDVEEIKRRELEGAAGLLAKVLGRYFDEVATQVADGKVDQLSGKINAEVQKKIGAFKQYGVLSALEYQPDAVVLHFDVTRLRKEGAIGHVLAGPREGAVPLHRWVHPRRRDHYYTTAPGEAGRPGPAYAYQGVVAHVPASPGPGVKALARWRGPREWFYTADPRGEGLARVGYRPEAPAALLVYDAPAPGTLPFYRFVDPITHQHFYTTHPHAEFAK